MISQIFLLASIGGMISFAATSLGTTLSLFALKTPSLLRFKFSMDFALGLMLSAVAFTLVGPVAINSLDKPELFKISLLAFIFGCLIIYALTAFIKKKDAASVSSSSQMVLALALIVHNFPEGLASGASLAGLELGGAIPILTSIALQNIPEGLLMVMCLKSMGWSPRNSFLGGIISGLVELIGGISAGLALNFTTEALPLILMVAGGAMFTSVAIELNEKGNFLRQLRRPEFTLGLFSIPLLNSLVG